MLPTIKQWKKWSLPSKYSLIGIILGIFGIVLPFLIDFFDSTPNQSEISKATERTVFLFLDNYDEKMIGSFVENIMIADRVSMLLLIKKMFRYSSLDINSEYRETWINFLNTNEESIYNKSNINNEKIADLIKILATHRLKIKKLRNKMVVMLNRHITNMFYEIKGRKYKSFKLDKIESESIERLLKRSSITESGKFNYLFKKEYYMCHDSLMMIALDQMTQSYLIYGIPNYGKFYSLEDGWGYYKVASDSCSAYIGKIKNN